jgi:hypothetical protein
VSADPAYDPMQAQQSAQPALGGMQPDQAGSPPEGPQGPMGSQGPDMPPDPGSANPADAQGQQGGQGPVLNPLDQALRQVAMQAIGEQNPDALKSLGQAAEAFAKAGASISPPMDPNRQAGLAEDQRVHDMEHERGLRELEVRQQEADAKAEQAQRAAESTPGAGG